MTRLQIAFPQSWCEKVVMLQQKLDYALAKSLRLKEELTFAKTTLETCRLELNKHIRDIYPQASWGRQEDIDP